MQNIGLVFPGVPQREILDPPLKSFLTYFHIFLQPTRQRMRTYNPRQLILHSDIRLRRLN